jgi:transposase-like protein
VITSVQRRRRWSAEEKAAVMQETYAPGMSVSLVARRHGIAPSQLFTWRRHGYRRVHALIWLLRQQQGGSAVNVKRVYRIMKAHGLLLQCGATFVRKILFKNQSAE